MRLDILISATLASLATASALPKEVMERQTGTGTVRCPEGIPGPYSDQVRRGISRIALKANAEGKICQPRNAQCDRISEFGTAGFQVCSIVNDGLPPTCWDASFVAQKFYEIVTTCPESEPNSIWSRIYGQYSVADADLPAGTTWGRFQLENIEGGTGVKMV